MLCALTTPSPKCIFPSYLGLHIWAVLLLVLTPHQMWTDFLDERWPKITPSLHHKNLLPGGFVCDCWYELIFLEIHFALPVPSLHKVHLCHTLSTICIIAGTMLGLTTPSFPLTHLNPGEKHLFASYLLPSRHSHSFPRHCLPLSLCLPVRPSLSPSLSS